MKPSLLFLVLVASTNNLCSQIFDVGLSASMLPFHEKIRDTDDSRPFIMYGFGGTLRFRLTDLIESGFILTYGRQRLLSQEIRGTGASTAALEYDTRILELEATILYLFDFSDSFSLAAGLSGGLAYFSSRDEMVVLSRYDHPQVQTSTWGHADLKERRFLISPRAELGLSMTEALSLRLASFYRFHRFKISSNDLVYFYEMYSGAYTLLSVKPRHNYDFSGLKFSISLMYEL